MFDALIYRLGTIPAFRDWLEAAVLLAVFSLIALPFGIYSGVLTLRPDGEIAVPVLYAFFAVLFPALAEEIVFRGLMLPEGNGKPPLGGAALSLAAYMAWHPFVSWQFMPEAWPIFTSPAFLLIVAGLGTVLTVSVLRSGSLWPAVVMHWLVVVAWKAAFGPPSWPAF